MPTSPSFISLYSGCGGMDIGFINAGFECKYAFDVDKYALDVHRKNLTSRTRLTDLTHFDDEIISEVSMVDVLIAGPPCQGFSTAGKNNPSDKRNSHLKNVASIAAQAKPKVVVIENVKGLLNKLNSTHFEETIATLENAGYRVTWDLHNASDYGVAQNRKRVVIFATLSERSYELSPRCLARQNVIDVLGNSDEQNGTAGKMLVAGTDGHKIAKRIKPGQKLSNVRSGHSYVHTWEIPEVFGSVTSDEISFLETIVKLRRQNRRRLNGDADPVEEEKLVRVFDDRTKPLIKSLLKKGYLRRIGPYIDITNTFNGKYRRLIWDEAAPTVDTRFGQARYFLHPEENRGFSVRESARLQSFPDDFIFPGSESAAYRMIGNAVPPKFAEAIAHNVKQIWREI